VSPRSGFGDVEKNKFLTLPRLELEFFGRPNSQSLYRLSHPGFITKRSHPCKPRKSLELCDVHLLDSRLADVSEAVSFALRPAAPYTQEDS
jgi:hypothetical protein